MTARNHPGYGGGTARQQRYPPTRYRGEWYLGGTYTLERWLSATESGSTVIRRIVAAWRQAHGWKRVKQAGGDGAKDTMVWTLPHPELLPHYLGGKVYISPVKG